jgi:hypothetical protein
MVAVAGAILLVAVAAGCGQAVRIVSAHSGQAALPEVASAPLRAGERFLRLQMPEAYTPVPPSGGTDEYRCFLLDPQLTQAAFVTGSQFLPQNAKVVHHAIFFRIDPSDVQSARNLDASTPDEGWTCFGGTGVGGRGPGAQLSGGGGSWIGAWAPGATETVLNANLGYKLDPGSVIVMQVHYNLLATGGKAAGPDQSGLQLRLADGAAKLTQLQTTLLPGQVELPCAPSESGPLCDREKAVLDVISRFGSPAGATVAGLNLLCNGGNPPVPGSTQHCDMRVRSAGTIYAVAGHMHLLGRSIKVELNPGTPKAQTLLDVPVYNFDDQGAKSLATPVSVKPGDMYRVTCTHDATLRTKLPQLSQLPARYVVWGDGTSDEMCLGVVVWARPSA